MYNPKFCNKFSGNFTFQAVPNFPPPPPPPSYFLFPSQSPENSDEKYIKHFEKKIPLRPQLIRKKIVSIAQTRDQLKNLVSYLNNIKELEKRLSDNVDKIADTEWCMIMKQIEANKADIEKCRSLINDTDLDDLKRLIAKRTAKRQRLKRVYQDRKREREERIKERREISRKMEEKIQKIKDNIKQAKQDEEAKLQADVVLKEVLRKKHDAKKCITKLEALARLRRARHQSAAGRGQELPARAAQLFDTNIEKLKSFWTQRLVVYEQEENQLREKLKGESDKSGESIDVGDETERGLRRWRECLFGEEEAAPQKDFGGDVDQFVAARLSWDQYISTDGSPLPVGWVLPTLTDQKQTLH